MAMSKLLSTIPMVSSSSSRPQQNLSDSFIQGVDNTSYSQRERTLIRTKTSKPIITKLTKETLNILEEWFYVAEGEGETHPDIMTCFHMELLYYTNANDERFSIQAEKDILRNILV